MLSISYVFKTTPLNIGCFPWDRSMLLHSALIGVYNIYLILLKIFPLSEPPWRFWHETCERCWVAKELPAGLCLHLLGFLLWFRTAA